MALPLSYHWRSLFERKTTTLLTVGVVGAVVGTFAWMLSFAGALRGSLSMANDRTKLIVIKRGATAEGNSALPIREYAKLTQLTDIARDEETGELLLSAEMLTQVSLPRLGDGGRTVANVAVRGVTEKAFKVHRSVRLTGQRFSLGDQEVIVGAAAARQFAGLEIGQTIALGSGGHRSFRIVGYFSAEGGPMESEIWGYLPLLMDSYSRTLYSSASLRLREGALPEDVIARIEGPTIQLSAQTEARYWEGQSRFIRIYLLIAYVLISIMCFAAVFSIANTMFAAVAGRTREIAMLRTIGFSGQQILSGFLVEAVMLSLIGGLLGCGACWAWLAAVGRTKDMFGANTFTTLAFEIRMTPWIVTACMAAVCPMGIVGALAPAWRAARLRIVSVLRET